MFIVAMPYRGTYSLVQAAHLPTSAVAVGVDGQGQRYILLFMMDKSKVCRGHTFASYLFPSASCTLADACGCCRCSWTRPIDNVKRSHDVLSL